MSDQHLAKFPRAIFVTGTDTDCGKTFVSSALISALRDQGYGVVGMKPVASGSDRINGSLVNGDVESLKRQANIFLPDRIINPFIYEPAISPHFAAELTNEPINLDIIVDAYHQCLDAADIVIVEGAGGWRVPLGNDLDISILVQTLNLPVLLVSGLKLGTINHTLLTAEAIENDGVELIAWVANLIDPNYENVDATVKHLNNRMNAPCLAQFPWYDPGDESALTVNQAASVIDLTRLSARRSD